MQLAYVKTGTNMKLTITRFLIIAVLGMAWTHAAVVNSIANGDWENASTWSTGAVPGSNDQITVSHNVFYNPTSAITIGNTGSLTVSLAGVLTTGGSIVNQGTMMVNGSITIGKNIDNFGVLSVSSTGNLVTLGTGNNYNRPGGTINLDGEFSLAGNFFNQGTLNWSSTATMNSGNFQNDGTVNAGPGMLNICGNASNPGTINGTLFLCCTCGSGCHTSSTGTGNFTISCAPFSVQLNYFKGEYRKDKKVLLMWQTGSEAGNAYFAIERSTVKIQEECKLGACNANTWQEIGIVNGAGTSTQPIDYSFVDENPVPGVCYYRLKMMDIHGKPTYSAVVEVWVETEPPSLTVYPNPTHDILNLRLAGTPGQKVNVEIYAIDGRKVWELSYELLENVTKMEAPVCGFPSGAYIVNYRHGEQKFSRKVIIVK